VNMEEVCMKSNQFSVSMCVYGKDNPEHFDEAITSIVNQTVKPTEIVLVVDGPIPETIERVIQKHKSIAHGYNLKVIYLDKNMGHGKARRICFDNCECDLIAIMDADDISVHNRFEKQIDFFERHPELSIVGGYIHEFTDSPDKCVGKRVVPADDMAIKEYMKRRCPMNQVTVMFRKKDVADVGGYIDWYCEEDYYLWIRLAMAGKKFGNVDENMVYVRVGDEMYQRRGGWKYFRSEEKLQRFMLKNGITSFARYSINVTQRLLLQVLMPNKLRGIIFQKFARS
jgi:glycosyltransferase involved in cell wall biosynthesis